MSPDKFLIEDMARHAYNAAYPQRTVLWDDLPGWRKDDWYSVARANHRQAAHFGRSSG